MQVLSLATGPLKAWAPVPQCHSTLQRERWWSSGLSTLERWRKAWCTWQRGDVWREWRVDGIVILVGVCMLQVGMADSWNGSLLTLGKGSSLQVMLCKLERERLPNAVFAFCLGSHLAAADAPCVLRNSMHPHATTIDILSWYHVSRNLKKHFHQGLNGTRLHQLQK